LAVAYTNGLLGDDGRYVRASASFGGVINLWHQSRFLVLRIAADTLVPIRGTVPFSELPTLGGPEDLRGFPLGRFRDYSTLLFTAEYRWPVWIWADAGFFSDVGATGGVGWRGLSPARAHPDIGFALHVRSGRRFALRMFFAYGFNEGFQFAVGGDAGR
jgi:outer membrane protein assembly factor BamA